jgi:hypothetical protein
MSSESVPSSAGPAPAGPFEIRSEPRGPHWIAWLVRAGSATPDRGIVIVGETQDEAEARARRFAEQALF